MISKNGWDFDRELREICALPPGPERERRRKDWARRLALTFQKPHNSVKAWQKVTGHSDEPQSR